MHLSITKEKNKTKLDYALSMRLLTLLFKISMLNHAHFPKSKARIQVSANIFRHQRKNAKLIHGTNGNEEKPEATRLEDTTMAI